MERYKLQPFTPMEQRIAEDNHNTVYAFLHDYKYDVENFYGIAVIGYLKGIQNYCRNKELQEKFDLYYVCWNYMRAEMENHFTMDKAQKRVPKEKICSLDVEETENVLNLLIGKSVEDEYMERNRLGELMGKLTEVQKVISKMKMEGFNNTEIFLMLDISSSSYYREINQIKAILEKYVA